MLSRFERLQPEYLFLLAIMALAALAAVALAVFVPLAPLALVALGVALSVAWLLASRPWAAFGVFVMLLPAHVVLMAVLLVVVGLPASVVKGLSAWKEALLALLLVAMVVRFRPAARISVTLPDLLIGVYGLYVIALGAVSLFTSPGLSVWAYGVRDVLLPLALYLLGRSLPINEASARYVMRLMLVAALVFSSIGLIERLLIPTEFFVTIGLPRYFRELLGIYYPDYLMGLPENFWTSANSGLLRRAVSIYGSSQPFALSFLLLLPFCVYGLIEARLPSRGLIWLAFLVSLAGLLLTITRFTILLAVGLMILAATLSSARARRVLAVGLVTLAVAGIVVLIVAPSVRLLVLNTLTFQDHSSRSRLLVWGEALRQLGENPVGLGLGSAGQTAVRFTSEAVRIEGQYSKVGVEQGLVGLGLYIATLASLSMYLLRGAFRSSDIFARGVCFALALAFIGLSLNSMTTEWQNSPALLYPAYWLAGSAVAYAAEVSLRRRTAQTVV